MLGCLRRRGARKTPKRLRALRFRTVGPWLYLGRCLRKKVSAVGANPLRSCFHGALPTARMTPQGNLGPQGDLGSGNRAQALVIGKRQGTLDLARGTGSRGGRGGDLVDVPVRCLSRCRSRQAVLAQRSPSPIRILSKEGWGTRWTGAWPTDVKIVRSRSAIQGEARSRTKLFTAKLRVVERAVGDERTDHRQAGCATPRKAGPRFSLERAGSGTRGGALAEQVHGAQGAQSSLERAEEEQRISSRTKAPRTGKSFDVSRRRGGIGLGEPHRIGQTCTAKRHAPVSMGIATGVSEARSPSCVGSDEHAPTVQRRSAEAIVSVVKRSGLRYRWAASHLLHDRRLSQEAAAGDDEPGRGRVRVLVDGV